MSRRWADLLTALVAGRDLSGETASWAMAEVLDGNVTDAQLAGFAVALRAKGETVDELAALAHAMLEHARPVELTREAVDIVGTGGDRANTVNVSTMAAIVATAAGATVVKHGNRAASSACGTADCLEALGVRLDVPATSQQAIVDRVGIAFLFAPLYHPALRHAASARRELGISTTFNFLGPLTNPARPLAQAVGVADHRMADLMAGVFAGRGARGLVFHGTDGLDELTTTSPSDVWLFSAGDVTRSTFDPRDLGIAAASPDDLVGGDPAHNAAVVRRVFAGERGAVRDIVALNAAAALLAYEGPRLGEDLAGQLEEPFARTRRALDDGAAQRTLDAWVAASQDA